MDTSDDRYKPRSGVSLRAEVDLDAGGVAGPMPTVLRVGPYWFYFHSHEPNEPPHMHVDRDLLSA